MHIGPYEILGELGRGAMGVVYRARRADLAREFAVKVVLPEHTADPDSGARLVREAQAAARLAHHPGIVGVHDTGVSGDQVWLAMDLVEGRPLDALLAEARLDAVRAAALVAQAARAVHAAHEAGVLHRDIKPANILVGRKVGVAGPPAAADDDRPNHAGDPGVRALVADFGLARVHRADASLARLTRSGALVGTPAYMSPEQARGDPLDARSDVHALGATLFECLVGRPPFAAGTVPDTLARVLRDDPPSPARLARDVPAALDRVARRCLAKAPADRYPDAAALAEDLERFGRGERVLAGRAIRPATRRRLAVAVFVAIVAAGAWWAWRGAGERSRGTARATADVSAERTAAEQAATMSAAHAALLQACAGDLRVLQDAWHGAPLAPGVAAAARERVQTAAEALRTRPGASGVAAAWSAFAAFYAGDAAAAARALLAAEPGDPFPEVARAWIALAAYVREAPLPALHYGSDDAEVAAMPEPADGAARRAVAAESLRRAAATAVWARLDVRHAIEPIRAGAEAFAAGRHRDAASTLAALRDDPWLGPEVQALAAMACLLDQRPAEALVLLNACAARGWRDATIRAAATGLAVAALAPAAQRPALWQAAADRLDPVIAAGDDGQGRLTRGLARLSVAATEAEAGRYRPEAFADALEDLERAWALDRDSVAPPIGIARGLLWRAKAAGLSGAPDGEDLARAAGIADALVDAGGAASGAAVFALRASVREAYADATADRETAAAGYRGAREDVARETAVAPSVHALTGVRLARKLAARTPDEAEGRAAIADARRRLAARAPGDLPADDAPWQNEEALLEMTDAAYMGDGLEAEAALARASRLLDVLRAAAPGEFAYHANAAEVACQRAALAQGRGADAAALLAATYEAVQAARDLAPAHPAVARLEAEWGRRAAGAAADGGANADAGWAATIARLDALVAERPGDASPLALRRDVWMQHADAVRERGEPFRDAYARAVADALACVRLAPTAANRLRAARIQERTGDLDGAIAAHETLEADPALDAETRAGARRSLESYGWLGRGVEVPAWAREARVGLGALARGEYGRAREVLGVACGADPGGAPLPAPLRELRGEAFYELACALAQGVVGRDDPSAPSAPVATTAARALAGRAIAALRSARTCGFTNWAWAREDSDLEPLHTHPEWAAATRD